MRYPSCASLVALAVVFCVSLSNGAPTGSVERVTRDYVGPEVVKDSYIVVFKDGVNATDIEAHEATVGVIIKKRHSEHNKREKSCLKRHKGTKHKYSFANFQAYNLETDSETIARIAVLPEVAYVERNAVVHVTGKIAQSDTTYGLSRISHRDKGATNYIYDSSACTGTRAYVVDSGIFLEHNEFGGRAIWGTNIVNTVNTDENGHGTHVSGIIGGKTFGVCKANTLVAVKVVDANGDGTFAGVIAGIQWAVTNAISLQATSKSVINLSLAGPFSAAVNAAVASTVAAGITVVVAAGNENSLASNDSPASAPSAITVAAIDDTDTRGDVSNLGPSVDLFAPGWGVESAYIGGVDATMVLDGTSQASPHVAGLALYFIVLEGFTSPAQVTTCILTRATPGKVGSAGAGSPNLIAYNGSGY